MTIALGILARDGVVLAADTLETVQGYWKGEQGKIRWIEHHGKLGPEAPQYDGALMVSGTGRSGAVEAIAQKLKDRFNQERSVVTAELLQPILETELLSYYTDHVVPYAAFNDPLDAGLQVLVAYERNARTALWCSDRGTLINQMAIAVGIGAYHAKTLLGRFGKLHQLSVQTVAAIAAYIVFDVKEHIDGCGRYTDVRFIQDHEVRVVPRLIVESMEDAFREYSVECAPSTIQYLFEETAADLPRERLDGVRAQIGKLVNLLPGPKPA